jgi:hypothetical protein
LTNLSSCNDGLASDNSDLMNVHTSSLDEYSSQIRIANAGAVADSAELYFYNANSGRPIATWTSPQIPPGGSLELTMVRIESLSPALATAVADGTSQVNVKLEGLTGYLQHVVQNTRAGVVLDMSPKCDLGAAD